MNQITDDAILRTLGRQMDRAVAKQVMSASNIANLDTPGYRSREVVFDEILASEVGKQTAVTGTLQSSAHKPESQQVRETQGLQSRRDGNNVQLDRQLLDMNRAAGDFSAAQTVLSAKFRLIRYAINESR
jgi:flagellar basal-body rod protein FlgB